MTSNPKPPYPVTPLPQARWPWFRNTLTLPVPDSAELNATAMSGLPSPSKSATCIATLPAAGPAGAGAENTPPPWFQSTLTSPSNQPGLVATARSGLPSPSKSAAAIATTPAPVLTLIAGAPKTPPPWPRSTPTVLPPSSATAMSALPSPSKSATARDPGAVTAA